MFHRPKIALGLVFLIGLGVLVVKPGAMSRIRSLGSCQLPVPELSPSYFRAVEFHQRVDGSLPSGSVLFIGDSHVQGLAVTAVSARGVNFGIGSDTTVGVLGRLPQYRSLGQARAIVLAIGFNDLKRRDNDSILRNMTLILEKVPPGIPLLLCGVMAVDEGPRHLTGYNERIRDLNRKLSTLVEMSEGVVFLDPQPVLTGEGGSLPDDLHCGDGIHLSLKGYQIWIEAMREGLIRLGI